MHLGSLLNLPKEVLLKIFTLLDWQDILALEQTCSFTKDITTSKSLWISLFGELARQSCTPELPKYIDIRQLDYLEIRSLVVRTLRWIKICKGAGEGQIPDSIGNKQIVHIETPVDATNTPGIQEPVSFKLALNAKWLFLGNERRLEAYNVQKDTCVWTYTPLSDSNLVGFALEELSDSSVMILVVSFDSRSNVMSFELFCLELDEEKCTAIEHTVARDTSQRGSDVNLWVTTLCLNGEFAALVVYTSETLSVIVWNWKMEEQIDIIFGETVSVNGIQIVRDHLFFTLYTNARDWKLEILSLRKLAGHAPVVHFSDVESVSHDLSDTLFAPSGGVFLTAAATITLHDLSRHGTTDKVKVAIVATALSESSQLGAYVAGHYEVAMQTTRACDPKVSSIKCTEPFQHSLRHPSDCMSESLAVSTSNGRIVHLPGSILRLRNSGISETIQIYGFDERGKFYRTLYHNGVGSYRSAVELSCFSLVNFVLDGSKRVVIHQLI